MLFDLKNNALCGIIDYQLLMSQLQSLKAPHRKVTELLRKNHLIRIKKGLYILGDKLRDEPINLMLLANLIYGPSYVSQDFALQHYGLIPERVETVTNMTCLRNKLFNTPLRTFSYKYINQRRFTIGVDWLQIRKDIHVLIASPEKAICDSLLSLQDIKTCNDMTAHLVENMRIDEDSLSDLNLPRLEKIASTYRNATISLFYKTLKRGI